ncbi:MAG TPA: hypothetical protein VHM01_24250 [Alphaproteobacteria bacterium]|nr:hypothetical protein [Alphaproteobacteria bacterium]
MAPDRVDLDYLRGKAAEYRRHAEALASRKLSAHLLELARRYEARLRDLESRQSLPRRRPYGRG